METIHTKPTEKEEIEEYPALSYTVNFYNCTITNLSIQQTGKPSDPDDPNE